MIQSSVKRMNAVGRINISNLEITKQKPLDKKSYIEVYFPDKNRRKVEGAVYFFSIRAMA